MNLTRLIIVFSALSAVPAASIFAQSASHEVIGASEPPRALHQPSEGLAPAVGSLTFFSEARLDQLLAPIALYPDSVLTHILIASTYPLEVVEADRWRRERPQLDAESALRAAEAESWDASVKALVAFPELLRRMSDDLRWTQDLGDAFLMAEEEVIDRVQALRNDAWSTGELRSSNEMQVVVEKQIVERVERRTIIIEPAVERVVYLPHYDTRVVYGNWRWADYPPVYWDPFFPVSYRRNVVYWGPPVRVAPTYYIGAFHWPRRQIVVVNHYHHTARPGHYRQRAIAHHHSATRWQHKPNHRRGVAYHPVYQSRFDQRQSGYRPPAYQQHPPRQSGTAQRGSWQQGRPQHESAQRGSWQQERSQTYRRQAPREQAPRQYNRRDENAGRQSSGQSARYGDRRQPGVDSPRIRSMQSQTASERAQRHLQRNEPQIRGEQRRQDYGSRAERGSRDEARRSDRDRSQARSDRSRER